jgi:CheY-like chemotaxis protein
MSTATTLVSHTAAPTPLSAPLFAPQTDAERMRVLVVDDIGANLVAMRALLQDDTLEVLTASSGPEALELLLQHDFALALLDVQMPGMDGYALAELMRGTDRTRRVPIIFLTAGLQDGRGNFRGYEAGAVDFLYKPIDERVLRGKVSVFVELHRQRRTIALHAEQLSHLAHANALMLASLSNDLCEPLTVLALNSERLLQRADNPALRDIALRLKTATTVLDRQIDHLLSLAKAPSLELKVKAQPTDLAALLRERWPVARSGDELSIDGDTTGWWDRWLLERAIEQLLLQAHTYCAGAALRVVVDGTSRGAVRLQISFAHALSERAASHLLGNVLPFDGLPPPVGAGLREAERIARAHGGSLIGSSRSRGGTTFELLLPRGTPEA